MDIEFKEAKRFRYAQVPYQVYAALLNSSSKGKYWHRNIKGKYNWSPL